MYQLMIVDDETMSREMLQKYIETRLPAYQVTHTCSNGLEALEAFRQSPVDILLIDIRMPVMDGLELLEQLNRLTSNYVPVIISSYGEFEYAKAAMRLGVTHYLLKPLDFKELTLALQAASQTLSFKRIAYCPPVQNDDQELYLTGILAGKYTDAGSAAARFSCLDFPFAYDKSGNGFYIRIEFFDTEMWIYGHDALLTAISNLIRLQYPSLFLLPLPDSKEQCDYFIFDDTGGSMDFESLGGQISQILKISLSLRLLLRFSSMEQLRLAAFDGQLSELRAAATGEFYNPECAGPGEDNDVIRARIENAVLFMKENYALDLTRDMVAESVYMSGAYFSRCFKQVTGITYKDYLIEIRMQKAVEFLKTNQKISEIALKVGYPNPNRFNINFRHYTSYTPSEYRTYVLKMI